MSLRNLHRCVRPAGDSWRLSHSTQFLQINFNCCVTLLQGFCIMETSVSRLDLSNMHSFIVTAIGTVHITQYTHFSQFFCASKGWFKIVDVVLCHSAKRYWLEMWPLSFNFFYILKSEHCYPVISTQSPLSFWKHRLVGLHMDGGDMSVHIAHLYSCELISLLLQRMMKP